MGTGRRGRWGHRPTWRLPWRRTPGMRHRGKTGAHVVEHGVLHRHLQPPIVGETRTVAEMVDGGHGRIEQRRLQTSDVWVGYSDWPGLAQVFHLAREVITKKTGEVRGEMVAGVTSLDPDRADAARLLILVRGHWSIENQSHWVRDATFDEDRS